MMNSDNSAAPPNHRGWEHYPLNLDGLFHEFDLNLCHRRLKKETERLFDSVAFDVQVETVSTRSYSQAGVARRMTDHITQEHQLEEALARHLACHGDHYIFLRQSHTWSPFRISEAGFCQIATVFKVRPSFLDVVHSFGQPRAGHEKELFVDGYNWWHRPAAENPDSLQTESFGICYAVHYGVRTGRDAWPWSIRKVGIYHQYEQESATSTWIILQPTAAIRKLPMINAIPSRLEQFSVHSFMLRTALNSWTPYLQDLDAKIRQEAREARLDASSESPHPKPDFDLTFSKVQILQYRRELIRDVTLALASQCEVIDGISKSMAQFTSTPFGSEDRSRMTQLDRELDMCASQVALKQRWAKDMLEHAQQAAELITALLNCKNTQSLISASVSLAHLAKTSQQDSQTALVINQAMKDDSSMMKFLATVTMIYLPGTFVATLFSTGFVTSYLGNTDAAGRHQTFIQAGAYTFVTVLLTVITTLVVPSLRKRYVKP